MTWRLRFGIAAAGGLPFVSVADAPHRPPAVARDDRARPMRGAAPRPHAARRPATVAPRRPAADPLGRPGAALRRPGAPRLAAAVGRASVVAGVLASLLDHHGRNAPPRRRGLWTGQSARAL